jgi:hypothetical protein
LQCALTYAKNPYVKKLLVWFGLWVIVFSGMDYWGIRVWQIQRADWFTTYRTAMYEYISWLSPASFGVAENAYFVWLDVFDGQKQNWEWTFYTGNPINPDGAYNFVYGDGARYEMWRWYRHWLKNFLPWLGAIIVYRRRAGLLRSWADVRKHVLRHLSELQLVRSRRGKGN